MHDESTHANDLTRGDRDIGDMELDLVNLLTDPCRQPTIWSIPDIGRELEYFDPESLVHPLQRAGLLHQTTDGFVFATPAAFHLIALTAHVV
jgi:hypothetical protein